MIQTTHFDKFDQQLAARNCSSALPCPAFMRIVCSFIAFILAGFACGGFEVEATSENSFSQEATQSATTQEKTVPETATDGNVGPETSQSDAKASPEEEADRTIPDPWPEGFPEGPWWNNGLFCGPNALYVLLRLNDVPVTMQAVHDEIDIDPELGCTLEQIRIAGERLGMPLEERFVPISELLRVRPPFILHGAQSEDRDDAKGHFWVIVGYDEDSGSIAVVDGSSGIYSFTNASQVEKLYSGWVVVPTVPATQSTLEFLKSAFVFSLATVAIMGLILLLVDWRFRRRPPHSTSADRSNAKSTMQQA